MKPRNNKPVFFDTSGKRRYFVNVGVLVFTILAIAISSFVGVYVYRLNQINKIAKNTSQKDANPNTNIALLYTSTNDKAYAVARDQIEKVDTILLPKYFVSETKIETPKKYQEQIEDIRFISQNKPVHYNSYFLLSNTDYIKQPTERESISLSGKSISSSELPRLVTLQQMLAIRSDVVDANSKGLYVELDLSSIQSETEVSGIKAWLEGFRTLMNEKDLKLGIMFKASDLSPINQSIVENSDQNYIRFSQEQPRQEQIDKIAALIPQHQNNIIIEIPTVSTGLDRLPYNDYIKSVEYAEIEPQIIETTLTNRTLEPTEFTTDKTIYGVNDAVTANNLIWSLKAKNLIGNDTEFAITDPGYEEFTLWKLLQNPFEPIRNYYLLTENMSASLSIKQEGEGEVSSLRDEGAPGQRQIETPDKIFITASTVNKPQTPATVAKSGKLPKKIALTFDDGPHPEDTYKVLDILDKYDVKGTFFLVGSNVLANPDVAKNIVQRGHEVENHTYDHPVFSKLTPDSQINQIKANTELIEAVTGQDVRFFRKPFSDNNDIQTEQDLEYLKTLNNLGLEASEYDIDSKDWLLDTSDQVVEKVINDLKTSNGDYSQILFHDTHQNIYRTLDALPPIIEFLQSNNIEIVRVDQLVSNSTLAETTTTKEFRAIEIKNILFAGFVWINVFLVVVALLKYAWMIFGSISYHFKHRFRNAFLRRVNEKQRNWPTLGIIIACHNEELVIGKTLQGLLDSSYKKFRVTIIDDGSTDNTAEIVREFCDKDKRFKLLSIPNGGKANALVRGISITRTKWLVFCDADTIFDTDALRGFADSIFTNKRVGAVAGRIFVGNTINALTRSQAIEYGIAHIFTKAAQDIINSITVVPGALGLWNRDSLVAVGGFTSETLAEDADATMNLISANKRVKYFSSITARTEAPEKMKMLYKQRTRWQLGNMQATIKHRKGLFRKKYGGLGFFGLPMMIHELLTTLLYPALLGFTIFVLSGRIFNWEFVIPSNLQFITSDWFLLFSFSLVAIELLLSIFVIIREPTTRKQKLSLLLTLPYYLIIYKTFLSYSTLVAMMRAARGTLQGWGHLTRTATVKQ